MLVVFLVVSFAELIFILGVFNIIPCSRFLATVLPGVLVDMTNITRQEANLNLLNQNSLLEQAAKLKAEDMALKGYFSHTSPEGIAPWYWFDKVGYKFAYAGENLAVNFLDSSILHQAWLNSPSHKANIINSNFSEIGISTSQGIYKGKQAIFVVQLFGTQNTAIQGSRPAEPIMLSKTPKKINTNVLGETAVNDIQIIEEEESFIAVKRIGDEQATDTINPVSLKRYSSWYSRLFASPNFTISYFLSAIFIIVAASLILKIFVKIKIQFPALILNGVIILLIIVGALYFNHWLIRFIGKIV